MEIFTKFIKIIHFFHFFKCLQRTGTNKLIEFPLKQFLGVTNANFLRRYRSKLLCSPYMNQTSTCCQCESVCVRYRSCCADYHWYKGQFNNVEVYKRYLVELSKTFKDHECSEPFYHVIDNTLSFISFKSYYTVRSCPTSNKEEVTACQYGNSDFRTSLPVRGSDGYIYQNMYCARCNHVREFEPLPVRIKCDVNLSIPIDCEVQINSTENIVQCTGMRNCRRGNPFTDLCKSFQGILHRTWVNYFCMLCEFSFSLKTLENILIEECHVDKYYKSKNYISKPEFIDTTKEHDCKAKTIMDVAEGRCGPFSCPSDYQVSDSKCYKKISSFIPENLDVTLFDTCFLNQKTMLYGVNITQTLLKEKLENVGAKSESYIATDAKSNQTFIQILDRTDNYTLDYILSPDDDFIYHISTESKLILTQIDFAKLSFYENPTHTFQNSRLCAKPILVTSDVNITSNCDVMLDDVIIAPSNLSVWIEFNRNYVNRRIYTCASFHLPLNGICTLKRLRSNSTYLLSDGLNGIGVDRRYEIEDYVPLQGGFYVCSDAKSINEDFYTFFKLYLQFIYVMLINFI